MILLRNKDQQWNNLLVSFATCSVGKGMDISELQDDHHGMTLEQ